MTVQNKKKSNNDPIGVFDSGLGGLTTVMELRRLMPNENIIYFGDTGRVPYGTRSLETIKKYVKQDIAFLLSKGVKLIIVACNTASTVLSEDITASLPVPILEAISPAAYAALKLGADKKIGVIGTSATIKSGAYESFLLSNGAKRSVATAECPLFVPLVENGFIDPDNEVTLAVAKQYLAPLCNEGVETLILGCTHYPIIADAISRVMGSSVSLIDSGREAAAAAYSLLSSKGELADEAADMGADVRAGADKKGSIHCYVSDSTEAFETSSFPIIKNTINISHAEQIDIEKY